MDLKLVTNELLPEDGPLVSFGPYDLLTDKRLSIPAHFSRIVRLEELNLDVTLKCEFRLARVEVVEVGVKSIGGNSIRARDLNGIGIPELIFEICKSLVPDYEFWTKEFQDRVIDWGNLRTNDAFLAQMYWLNHATYGAPRQSLMEYMGIPRSTCNVRLKKIEKSFPLPRPGSISPATAQVTNI
jgi:hypothetical protein